MFFKKRRDAEEDEEKIWSNIDEEDDLMLYTSYFMQDWRKIPELALLCELFNAYREKAISVEDELDIHGGSKKTKKSKEIELELDKLLENISAEAAKQEKVLKENNVNFDEFLSKITTAQKASKDLE